MMKNRFSVVGLTSFIGLAISFLAGLSLFYKYKSASSVNAGTYNKTITQYYSDIDWDKTGSDLKDDLASLIKITSAGWSYDGLWDCYETSDTRADGTLWDIYSDQTSYTRNSPHSGTSGHSDEGDYVNREHVIPQSTFSKAAPMVSDAHHVLPSDGKVNNARSNYPHGNVSSATYTSNDGCKLGTGTNSTTVFEPKDCYKGDIARIYFYFVTCYQDKIDSNTYSVFQSSFPQIKQVYLNVYLQWAKDDPVSQKEIDRNNAIYAGQGNRNPFIDCPYAVGAIFDSQNATDYGNKGQYSGQEGLTISNTSLSLTNNETAKISATSSDSSNITWTTTNSNVVSLSATSSNSGSSITLTAGSTGTATVTASATIGGNLYSQSCSVSVTSSTKQLSSISISGEKTTYSVGDSFEKPTVIALFSDSSQETVTNSASFSGYDMTTSGNQTVTVSYTYSGTTKTTTYQITVNSSGGSSGGSSGSQRISASSASSYYLDGDTCPTGDTDEASTSCDAFDVTWLKNSGTNNIVYTYAEMRVYASHSFTFTPKNGYVLTSIVITANNSSYASAIGGSSLTNCSKDISSSTVTLTPTDGESAVGFTNSAQSRINYIVVNYSSNSGSSEEITSISATANKTFYVGDTITSSDLTVKDNNNNTVSGFSFSSYTFTYGDASSGGALTNKIFTNAVSYETFTCSLTVQVQRKAYSTPSGTSSLEHNGAEFSSAGIGSSYTAGQTATVDGITFAVDGYIYNSKLSLSSSKTSAPGKVANTTPYPSGITNVTVSGTSLAIQLSTDGKSWDDLEDATTSTKNYFYLMLYYSSTPSNYVNITSFTVTMKANETPENVANYIMYEDTTNQCTTKFDVAKGYFEALTSDGRATFMTSDDYVISTARTRLNDWATHEGKTISYSNNDYVISGSKIVNPLFRNIENNNIMVIVIVTSLGLISVGGYLFLKRKETK